jgi:GTP diphosphokinase / guanosine-3',5'-bis(diphosphate) 3'-diphosphatase
LVKGIEIPLSKPLQNGDIVEIIKSQEDCLEQAWLEFAITTSAKKSIQRGLKRIATARGWRIIKQSLENNIRVYHRSLELVSLDLSCSIDELAFKVGSETISIETLKELINSSSTQNLHSEIKKPLLGVEGSWKLASCCKPLPGDSVVGIAGSGNGPLRIHTSNCSTLQKLNSQQKSLVHWNSEAYTIHLQITIRNTPDIIRILLNTIANDSIASHFRGFHLISNETAKVSIIINNISRKQHDGILERMENVADVVDIRLIKISFS